VNAKVSAQYKSDLSRALAPHKDEAEPNECFFDSCPTYKAAACHSGRCVIPK
jgi:hypothetical protein